MNVRTHFLKYALLSDMSYDLSADATVELGLCVNEFFKINHRLDKSKLVFSDCFFQSAIRIYIVHYNISQNIADELLKWNKEAIEFLEKETISSVLFDRF